MFAIKIYNNKENRSSEFRRTVGTILNFMKSKLNRDPRVVSDNYCVEMISGEDETFNSGGIVTELLIKKTIFINNNDLDNREVLDKYLIEVKKFCEQADKIEGVEYLPINFR